MATAYQIAAGMAGSREGQAALSDYLKTGGQNLDPKTLAWCAAFANATLAKAGQKGTDSNMARSFLQWGQEVKEPQKGDVAVFSRGDPNGPYGHVGFFDSMNPDGSIRVLGGNQSDSVSYGNYPSERLLGFRRAGPGKVGGDGLVARDHDPQVAGQANASLFGSMAPSGGGGFTPPNTSIDPNVAAYAFGEEKDTWGSRLQNAGKSFSHAANEFQAPRISGGGGDARQTGNALADVMNNPNVADLLLKKRAPFLFG